MYMYIQKSLFLSLSIFLHTYIFLNMLFFPEDMKCLSFFCRERNTENNLFLYLFCVTTPTKTHTSMFGRWRFPLNMVPFFGRTNSSVFGEMICDATFPMSFTDLKVVALLESSAPALSQEVDGHGTWKEVVGISWGVLWILFVIWLAWVSDG